MNKIHQLTALFLAALLTLTTVVPASAARVYDRETKRWVEASELQTRGRNYTPIQRKIVDYDTNYAVGTIVVETSEHYLYLVLEDDKALRYGVGVGRDGFQWSGSHRITRKAEWPGWTPPAAMRERQPGLPAYMPGGPENPLGARALYIGNTLYRLHGTSEPWTIGHDVSSGCIRLTNDDIIDLYDRVGVGTLVVVRR
ncbi:MAG: L,D-transpeptidase [Hyphomicrobiaceae bacterium]|nr:L,D-transpeptidase [Hyphomicrobiaceae bacterium]